MNRNYIKYLAFIVLIIALPLSQVCIKKKVKSEEIFMLFIQNHPKNPKKKDNFTKDIYGIKYLGQTGNYIDDRIMHLGAYEKYVLFLLRDIIKK